MNNTKTKQIIAGLPDDIFLRTANPTNQHLSSNDLKALAAAVPEWVPMSERLPEQSGFYLCSFDYKDGASEPVVNSRYYHADIQRFHDGGVDAWMPLPAPYQEDKDDIEEKIRKVTERGDAITGDEFERGRR